MYKTIFSVALLLLLVGCGQDKAKEVTTTKEATTPKVEAPKAKVDKDLTKNVLKGESKAKSAKDVSKFYTIFKDAAKIDPNGKFMLLVFGREGDAYTQKLKNDIVKNIDLGAKIRKELTPIYIDAMGQKLHKFKHSGKLMDVDTKTLISIYNITSTPTLIFTDKEGASILVVPGYMPPKQFDITIEFLKEGIWKGKDRKNGDVYKALKDYYKSHGIEIREAKDEKSS